MAEVEEVDRISNLPDALCTFILSYLSTKEAVATSILSKRWESLWTKVPALDFSLKSGSAKDFIAFVDRVLIRNNSRSLRLFQLSGISEDKISDYHYRSWIRNILRRDVVEVNLSLMGGTLPAGTFSSSTLTVLKLSGFYSPLRAPFYLPCLLALHFKHIVFTYDFCLNNLLMSLPRLEELIIHDCVGPQNMCIRSSSLKRLKLALNIVFSSETEMNTVDCPSLEYLRIMEHSVCMFGKMPSLTRASLFVGFDSNKHYDVGVINILNQASNLETLRLDVATKERVPGYTVPYQLPLFPNLTRLIVAYHFSSTNCSNFSWRHLALYILHRAPSIISFDYSSEAGKYGKCIDLGLYLPQVGQLQLEDYLPYLYHLKQYPPQLPVLSTLSNSPIPTLEAVNASLMEVTDADKILLEHLLNNAVNLKVFKINLKGEVNGRTMDAITGWLYQVPRASSECQIIVSPPYRGSSCVLRKGVPTS